MTESSDEPFTSYGLLAEAVRVAPDLGSVSYRLRANARWHDGQPITPEDVVWSFDVLKANSPFYAAYYQTRRQGRGDRAATRSPSPSPRPATASCRR